MAGFMSGFGPAFANSFTQTRRDIDAREDDLFKIKYNDFLRTKDERMKTQKEEQQAMSQAQQLAADMNDPNAAPFLYKQIMDFGVANVQKKLDDGRLTYDEGYKPQDVQEEPKSVSQEMDNMLATAPGVSSVGARRINSRLEEATGGTYSQVKTPADSPYSGVDTGAFTWAQTKDQDIEAGQLQDAIYRRNLAVRNGNLGKAMEEKLKIDSIMESQSLAASIKANAEQGAALTTMSNSWINIDSGQVLVGQQATKNGKPVILAGPKKLLTPAEGFRQMSVAELKDRQDIRTVAGGEVEDYNIQVGATVSMLDISGRLITIVNQDENVLAKYAGGVAENISTGIREVDAFGDMISNLRKEVATNGSTEAADKLVQEAESEFNTMVQSGTITAIQDQAARKKVFDNLRTLLAYRQAEAMEGGGRFSDKDIDRHLEVISAFTTKETFIDGLRGMMQESIQRTGGLETSIENNSKLSVARSNFEEQYGYDMYDDSIKPLEFFIDQASGPSKDFIAVAWEEAQRNKLFSQSEQMAPEQGPPMPTTTTAPAAQPRHTPEEIEAARQEWERRKKLEGAAGRKARRD